jgi:hypothetical protein
MRRFFLLPVLTLAITLPARADATKKSDLEPKALDILKQVAAVHKDAKSMHVEVLVLTNIDGADQKRQVKTEATYDMEKPNRFALKTKIDGKSDTGPDLVCDGKKTITHAKSMKQFTEEAAVSGLAEIGERLQQFRLPTTGILFQNVLTEDPYETLMQGVEVARYAGTEKVNGMEAHHLKFEQPALKWELWVAATGKPVVLKALSQLEADDAKRTVAETYQNWKIDGETAKDAFTFTPSAESKKVKEIKPAE